MGAQASSAVMRALALAFATLLLAGCADDPEPVEAASPTFSDAEVPLGRPLAPITWTELHAGGFTIAPAQPYRAGLTVPTGTLQVLVNFTLDAGGTTDLWVTLGECSWRREVTLVMGQVFGADCGGLAPAKDDLQIAVDAGAIAGRVQVVAAVCDARAGGCPAAVPVTRDT